MRLSGARAFHNTGKRNLVGFSDSFEGLLSVLLRHLASLLSCTYQYILIPGALSQPSARC